MQLAGGVAILAVAIGLTYFFGISEGTTGPTQFDIYMVLDTSGSMICLYSDVTEIECPEKFQSAKDAATSFVDTLNIAQSADYRIGLIAFADEPRILSKLTNDETLLKNSITSLEAGGGTAMGEAILMASNSLAQEARPNAGRIILLLSDGAATTAQDPIGTLSTVKANDITIFSVGYGTDADSYTMTIVAESTGGKYYYAPSGQELSSVFSEIAEVIISPLVHYGSRTLILIAIPILLFLPAIEKGIATMMGKREPIPICPNCRHVNYVSAKFCAKCGRPMKGVV